MKNHNKIHSILEILLVVLAYVIIVVGVYSCKKEEPVSRGTAPTDSVEQEQDSQKTTGNDDPNPGDVLTNSIGMKLVWIPPGEFMMDSGRSAASLAREYYAQEAHFADEPHLADEHPQHKVRLVKGFWMGQTEVTQAQYEALIGTAPWSGQRNVQQSDSNPAVCVSWNDAVKSCTKLSQLEGKTYRLPTEAEWEYACRAGTTTRYSFGDSGSSLGDYAWFSRNAWDVGQRYAHQVGQKKSNAFGLYDMHGNVWEWCGDWYVKDYYSKSPSIDPQGPSSGSSRVFRGGSWNCYPKDCRSAARTGISPDIRGHDIGFRIVLVSN